MDELACSFLMPPVPSSWRHHFSPCFFSLLHQQLSLNTRLITSACEHAVSLSFFIKRSLDFISSSRCSHFFSLFFLQQNLKELSTTSLHFLSSYSFWNLFQSGYHWPHSTVTAFFSLLKDPQVAQFYDPLKVLIVPDMLALFDGVQGLLLSWNTLFTWPWVTSLWVFLLSCWSPCLLSIARPLNIGKPRAHCPDLFLIWVAHLVISSTCLTLRNSKIPISLA